jgi:hypothetical protein
MDVDLLRRRMIEPGRQPGVQRATLDDLGLGDHVAAVIDPQREQAFGQHLGSLAFDSPGLDGRLAHEDRTRGATGRCGVGQMGMVDQHQPLAGVGVAQTDATGGAARLVGDPAAGTDGGKLAVGPRRLATSGRCVARPSSPQRRA